MLSAKIAALDLSFIGRKLMKQGSRYGWGITRTTEAVAGYRAFLLSAPTDPEAGQKLTRDVDECWHIHILSTERYAHDCNDLFGRFLHHQCDVRVAVAEDDTTCDMKFAETEVRPSELVTA